MHRGIGHDNGWASYRYPYCGDDRMPFSHGDAFVFGAFVVFVTHDLARIELKCMSGATIKARRP